MTPARSLVNVPFHRPASDARDPRWPARRSGADSPSEPRWTLPPVDDLPKSTVQRWSTLAIKACRADHDLRTLSEWASLAGLSYSSLCEACRIVGLQPHEARDFVRALRALFWASIEECHPQVLLDINDRRTLKAFVRRAGPSFQERRHSVHEFVRGQRFVSADNGAVRFLLACFIEASRRDVRTAEPEARPRRPVAS